MGKVIKQVLSNETLNDKGYVVFSDGIKWSPRYTNNNVLFRDHDSRRLIGNVENIHRDGKDWIGTLKFDMKTDDSRISKEQYEAGSLRGVSIRGVAKYYERDGVKFATSFEVYEISLLSLPSNPDCVSTFEGQTMPVMFSVDDNSEKLEDFSSEVQTKIEQFMSEKVEGEKEKNSTEPDKTVEQETFASKEQDAGQKTEVKELSVLEKIKELLFGSEKLKDETESAEKVELESATTPATTVDIESQAKDALESVIADQAKETDKEQEKPAPRISNAAEKFNSNMERKNVKSIYEFCDGKEGQKRFADVVKFSSISDEKEMPLGGKELVQEFIASASCDEGFKSFLSAMTFDYAGQYGGSMLDSLNRMEGFASGINSMNFAQVNPDLARIEWSSLIYRLLLPSDEWAGRCARIAAPDRAAVIYPESAIQPKVYFGKRAPLGISSQPYDDTAHGIILNLFAVNNILWQPSNSDLLSYNPMALGQSEILRVLQYKIHNFYLQKFSEGAGIKIPTTSANTFSATGAFPANPNATGTLKQISTVDIISMQTAFQNQNFSVRLDEAEMVMPSTLFGQLQNSENVYNQLYKNSGALYPDEAHYSGFVVRQRPITSLYDSASSSIIDPELYLDGKINDQTGAVPTYTPPVLAGTAVGTVLAFIPSECIIAIGATHVHQVPSAANYGYEMSMDIRTGAGVARTGGKGVGVIYPAVNA